MPFCMYGVCESHIQFLCLYKTQRVLDKDGFESSSLAVCSCLGYWRWSMKLASFPGLLVVKGLVKLIT